MELHPDKNPDQSEEDAQRYKLVTQGYKITKLNQTKLGCTALQARDAGV